MRHGAFVTALLALGVAFSPCTQAAELTAGVVGRVWVATEPGALPGSMLVLLPDGTLLFDSCFETYSLRAYTARDATHFAWDEDGMGLTAEVKAVTSADLTLALTLVSGVETRRFRAAQVPFICPDMPR
jgi:hypothetical protein